MKLGFSLNLAKAFSLSSIHFGYMLNLNLDLTFNLFIDLELRCTQQKLFQRE